MWLTDLPDAIRKGGLTATEVPGWRTRGHGQMAAVRGIICHHTAGPRTGNYPSLAVVRDGRPGLPGPLSQLGLARDGSVLVIAAGLAYHAGAGTWDGLHGNADIIGIEAESTGYGDWTDAQRDAYPRLCRALARHYGVPTSRVIAHREWTSRKIDPAGIDMNALRRIVASNEEDELSAQFEADARGSLQNLTNIITALDKDLRAAVERDYKRDVALDKDLRGDLLTKDGKLDRLLSALTSAVKK